MMFVDLIVPAFLALAVSALVAAALRWLMINRGHTRENYLGHRLPTSVGLALAPGFFAGFAAWTYWAPVVPSLMEILPTLSLVGVISLFGFIDDSQLERYTKGFSGHLKALASGQITTGLLKLVGGGCAMLLFAYIVSPPGRPLWLILLDAIAGALLINLMNLFDMRPGRALKVFIALGVAAFAGSLLAGDFIASVWFWLPWLFAAIGLLPGDLHHRHMLGDAGSNALGGVLAAAFVLSSPHVLTDIAIIAVLIAIHIYAERKSITDLIAENPFLRALDEAGRKD